MSHQEGLHQWTKTVTTFLPHLSKPQAAVLALWSFGMVLAHSCATTAVVTFLAALLKVKENTLRQRLREWCYDAEDKRGAQRAELEVESCFPFLLRWVLSWWQGQQLALAFDATALGDLFVVLTISVLYRGCAIPIAWTVLRGNQKHAWQGEWLCMLRSLKQSLSPKMAVIVLADRGLYAPWLFRRIRRMGWHPFLRINAGGTFHLQGGGYFRPLSQFAPRPGTYWSGRGTAFKKRESQIQCTLLAWWCEGTQEPWFILTDLPPEACDACWYTMRAWIEHGFKTTKRGGWQWHRTRMTDPHRATRLWLAISVATLWLLSVGGEADEMIPESTFLDVTGSLLQQKRQRRATRLRLVSVFRRGLVRILIAMLNHDPLPMGRFIPEPWPEIPLLFDVLTLYRKRKIHQYAAP